MGDLSRPLSFTLNNNDSVKIPENMIVSKITIHESVIEVYRRLDQEKHWKMHIDFREVESLMYPDIFSIDFEIKFTSIPKIKLL